MPPVHSGFLTPATFFSSAHSFSLPPFTMVRYSYDSNSDSSHYSSESGPGDEAKSFLPMPIQHRRPLGFFFDPRSIFRGRLSKAWRRRVLSATFVVASVGFLTFIFQSFDAHLLDEWHEKVASPRPLDDETGVLPRHLRPETYMVGDAATAHFRGASLSPLQLRCSFPTAHCRPFTQRHQVYDVLDGSRLQ